MAKKLKSIDKPKDAGPVGEVSEYAKQIWLAGLGAFNRAQEEGGKLFDSLVEQGREIEARNRQFAEEQVETVSKSMRSHATSAFDRLEHVFQDRVARALRQLGVPTNDDVQELSRRVEALNASLQELLAQEKRQLPDTDKSGSGE